MRTALLALLLAALLGSAGGFQRSGRRWGGSSSLLEPKQSETATGATREPRINFLFLAVDKVFNLDIWTNFFKGHPAERYRAYVHCKELSCKDQVAGSVLTVVPTVPSEYFSDLVSPMIQLLSVATNEDQGHPQDKFTFVSDSTLPAKPFSEVYAAMSTRPGSDFCVSPASDWFYKLEWDGWEAAVKAMQWVTLSRSHAEKAVESWSGGLFRDLLAHFEVQKVNFGPWGRYGRPLPIVRFNEGGLDEVWFTVALFGLHHISRLSTASTLDLDGFNNGPLTISASAGWQGQCDTYVQWHSHFTDPGAEKFVKLLRSLDEASAPHMRDDNFRPGWWDSMSSKGIAAIPQSDFLFVRKVLDNITLVGGGSFQDEYTKLVLED